MRKVTAEKEGVNEGSEGKTSNIQHPTPNIEVAGCGTFGESSVQACAHMGSHFSKIIKIATA